MLITGGSGYLGGELCRRAPGAVGTCFARAGFGLVEADVRDPAAIEPLVRPASAVIHTAYKADDRSITFDGSLIVARACAEAGARLVHLSTDLVFDGALGRPYAEEDEPSPVMAYGQDKLDAEREVAQICPDALIVRTSLIYGGAEASPHERLAVEGRDVTFFTDELRSPVQVGDLAVALLELAASDERGLLHLGGADGLSRHEFARLVVAQAGGDPDALASGLAAEHLEPRPLDCRLDSSRAAGVVSVRLRGAKEVLA